MMIALALLVCPAADPEVAPSPRPATGGLVIVGGGRVPDAARAEFVRLAGGRAARIVVIPTASADAADPAKAESFLAPWRAYQPASLGIVHRDDAERTVETCAKQVAAATGVWLSGGDQTRLTDAYRGTAVQRELLLLFRRGGVVGGTSAGAAALSPVMIAGGRDDLVRNASGFGLLMGTVIDQHFVKRNRLARLRLVLGRNPGLVGVGVDEDTALVVVGRTARVVGDSTVTLIWPQPHGGPRRGDPRREEVFKACSVIDWAAVMWTAY